MRYTLVGLFIFLAVSLADAQTLDLRQAQILAIERNLNLQAQTYATRAAEALVRRGFGVYDPVFEADIALGKEQLGVTSADLVIPRETDYRRFDFSLSQVFFTGGQLVLDFNNSRDDISPAPQVNPLYNSEARLSLIQPLLRGFGRTITDQEILFAVRDRNIAIQDLRQSAFDLLNEVRNAYFQALRYRDEAEFRRTSVALAERVLEENRARVAAGVLAPVEILEAQVGVQLRERELLDAIRAYEDALDRLTLRLNFQEPVEVAPEALAVPAIEADLEAGVQAAFTRRPDLLRSVQEIERLELAREIADNSVLPQLNLVGSYGHFGQREDYGDVLDGLADIDNRSWEVGVRFSYPIGNTAARHELQRTKLFLSGQKALLGQLRDQVRTDIRAAIRDLDVNRKKIEVTELGTRLARERLDTLLKRKEVGLATTRDVLQGEEDLAEARTLQIAALADYNQAFTDYLLATGELLEHEGFRLMDDISPLSERPLLQPQ